MTVKSVKWGGLAAVAALLLLLPAATAMAQGDQTGDVLVVHYQVTLQPGGEQLRVAAPVGGLALIRDLGGTSFWGLRADSADPATGEIEARAFRMSDRGGRLRPVEEIAIDALAPAIGVDIVLQGDGVMAVATVAGITRRAAPRRRDAGSYLDRMLGGLGWCCLSCGGSGEACGNSVTMSCGSCG